MVQPKHNPNLAPFPKIKDFMRGFTFTSSEEEVMGFNRRAYKINRIRPNEGMFKV